MYAIAVMFVFFWAAKSLNLLAMCGDFFISIEGGVSKD